MMLADGTRDLTCSSPLISSAVTAQSFSNFLRLYPVSGVQRLNALVRTMILAIQVYLLPWTP